MGGFSMDFGREHIVSSTAAGARRLLGPSEVAKWLGVSSGWVRDHATRKNPRIKSVKVGKLLRFRPEDVEHFIQSSSER
jgi:excisionase family DNA binding protein